MATAKKLVFSGIGKASLVAADEAQGASCVADVSNSDKSFDELRPVSMLDWVTASHLGENSRFVFLATAGGVCKKVYLDDFERAGRKGGLIAIDLDEGDRLASACYVNVGDDVVLASSRGKVIRFSSDDITPHKRLNRGVAGIWLEGDDCLVSSFRLPTHMEDAYCLLLTENRKAIRFSVNELQVKPRSGRGVSGMRTTDLSGLVTVGMVTTREFSRMVELPGPAPQMLVTDRNVPVRRRGGHGRAIAE